MTELTVPPLAIKMVKLESFGRSVRKSSQSRRIAVIGKHDTMYMRS